MDVRRKGAVGTTDRVVRLALGAVLVLFALFCPWAMAQGTAVVLITAGVGTVLIVTAAFRFCPLYRVLGLCTA